MSFGMFLAVGRRGKRRSCQLRERTGNDGKSRGRIHFQGHSERSRGIPMRNRSSVPRAPSTPLRYGQDVIVWKSAEIMNGSTASAIPRRSFGQTMRADVWWLQPLLVFLGLSTFIVYSTWAAFQGKNYFFGNYISPFYSPELFGGSPHSWFGPKPGWWPQWLLFSPALLVLWAPGGFRLTCYYYRGAYYKAFWADPPACTVGE